MSTPFKTFNGFCPKCDKQIAANASFCHHCGECLILREDSIDKSQPATAAEIQQLYKSATYLFMGWLFAFSLVIASGIFYHFYHQSSFLISTGVLFFYAWIFLISKLDELASKINKRLSKFVFLGLLIPVLGTIFTYLKISDLLNPKIA
jgi:hypothetical protein